MAASHLGCSGPAQGAELVDRLEHRKSLGSSSRVHCSHSSFSSSFRAGGHSRRLRLSSPGLVRHRRRKLVSASKNSSSNSSPSMDSASSNPSSDVKLVNGANGAVLEDVPHVTDWLPDLPTYANPLKHNPAYVAVKQYFVDEDAMVAKDIVVTLKTPGEGIHFRRAGPREQIYFKADEVRACIVTCGGLCPGLNTVIREIVCGLWTQYGVRDILGIEAGYKGFYSRNTRPLNPKVVNDIHKRGGTILGTSRGGSDINKIVSSIVDRGINQVYIIGGDGTQKGVNAIYEEIRKRGVKVAVAGIPKTIDNDIAVIDKSFGFDSAVEEAQRAIDAAHTEAESAENGVGLVKLMGRYTGYIAMYATLASRDVDCCLIPEVPFYLEGKGGLYSFVEKRLRENGHLVLVVAEGAGQELMAQSFKETGGLDASGNKLLMDVGQWLCSKLKDHFTEKKEIINLKYIDPTYMIRAIRSNASDNVYCTLLAHSAIHGAMAGYTGFTVGPVNNRHAYIPIHRVTEKQRHVNITDRMWARLLSSTNQPDFLKYDKVMDAKRKKEAASTPAESPPASIGTVGGEHTATPENGIPRRVGLSGVTENLG
ncbi:ATP-dependent 6-phosphofructokinase 6 [Selaginella moellendorffii]|nr:ATP-dependent 6-phosphofructokinase 6 [Selaginella moellendorffii]|eukprot:XP_002975191.2 ATP-dependent 6-phosphofructokinase 6 [Selaginella moellendorffii]